MNIRKEIRNKINNDDLSEFFDFLMNEQSVNYINEFMKNINNTNTDNCFLYIMALLYNEDISYISLPYMPYIYNNYANNKDDFGKFILEHFKPIHIRDKIINIYTGRGDILSYKNIDNLKENAKIIYSTLSVREKEIYLSLPGAIDDAYEFLSYFVRINNASATIEKFIQWFSYIYNRTPDIQSVISSTNDGYIPSIPEDTTIISNIHSYSEAQLNELQNAIDNFYSKIMSGTIYY